ncbi:MAG: RNA recognition motif domain-containing protein [Verrucomicrobiales bacterium]|nr:RNA-binding protein [Verrucomicrobiota bacterium JB025]
MDIYVGNLPYSCTEEEVSELFSAHGPVERVKIIIDRETGRSKGFGFVTISDESQLNAAIEAVNGCEFQGRVLRANASEPRPPRQGGGGYGGGGGGDRRGGGGYGGGGGGGGYGGGGGDRRERRERRGNKGGYDQW